MAELEHFKSKIYHEKQQPGSMLCAQHALNSLLQGNYFTAPDLASIAKELDELEVSYDDNNHGRKSTNMDDTGFFSIQVLENALEVWNLNLVRWRSGAMREFHSHPEGQQAFILNQEQHWFTLRRFGPEPGHWFNLNSSLDGPEWVGRTYLGMVLRQAEEEGYSVFTIISSTEDAHISTLLPRCEADALASTLPDPSGMQYSRLNMTRGVPGSGGAVPASLPRGAPRHGFEDEDLELQAALQASLLENSGSGSALPPQLPQGRPQPQPQSSLFSAILAASGTDPNDPVAASTARNRAVLARMQQEQAMALREGYVDEVARAEAFMRTRRRPAVPAGLLLAVDPDEGDDDDDLDYFDPEDDDYANAGHAQRGPPQMLPASHIPSSRHNRAEDDEEEAEVEDDVMTVDDDADWPALRRFDTPRADPLFPPPSPPFAQPGEEEEDMDADLAAAIKASLEEAGMEVPEDVRERAATSGLQSRQELAMPRAGYAPNQGPSVLFDDSDPESPVQEDALSEPISQALPSPPPQQQQQPPPPAQQPPPQSEEAVSVDELRRRRLARFGA